MPASTILVLEVRRDRRRLARPILTTAGYTVTRTTDPDEAFAKVAEHQLAVIDVGAGIAKGEDRLRAVPRDPGDAGDDGRPDPVRRRDR